MNRGIYLKAQSDIAFDISWVSLPKSCPHEYVDLMKCVMKCLLIQEQFNFDLVQG